jgi:putative flippase GtrA
VSGTPPDLSHATGQGRLPPAVTELLRYGGVAAIALAVDTVLLLVLSEGLGIGHLTAAAVGFLAGLAITAVLSERYAFSGPRIASPVLRHALFATIGVVGLLLLCAILWLLVDVRGLPLLPAKVLATAVVFTWNFLARRALFSGAPAPGRDDDPTVDNDSDDRDEGVTSSVV